ncbi:unnamed protein product [Pleuronectes platessa]|uniref:Uncharacterized protein n=1 Tax=Pleuronectes platessa TaxID=8262 RepID=A0A9N7VJK8_PLEPL|nr:unnamed protein product [Pleuronectes platessa]
MFGAGWILLGVAALWMSQLPPVSSDPTCCVSKQQDGFFKYELSEPHNSSCDFSWADNHNKVIANHLEINHTLVQTLTNQSITMKTCYHFLLFTRHCSGVMTNCSVNCTRLSEQNQNTTSDPVNPDLICFTVDRCLDPVTIGLCGFAAVVVVAAVVIAVVVWLCIYKPRCNVLDLAETEIKVLCQETNTSWSSSMFRHNAEKTITRERLVTLADRSGNGGSCVALASYNGGGPGPRWWMMMDPNWRQWTMTVDYSGSDLDGGS